MKVGDLVRAVWDENLVGVITEEDHDPLQPAMVFKVLWQAGMTGTKIWEGDLVLVNESR